MAARSVIRAACADDVRGGEYYGPSGFLELGGTTRQSPHQSDRGKSRARQSAVDHVRGADRDPLPVGAQPRG